MVQNEDNKILIHACCGICSGYPIQLLKEMGYVPVVYFCNPNLDTKEEFDKRLNAQKTICEYHDVELIAEDYDHKLFLNTVAGLENEPEKGARCDKCIELRLKQTALKTKELGIKKFTTSLVISPHKNYEKITEIGLSVAAELKEYSPVYLPLNFKKKDGFLKTNNLSKKLNIYRQNYCGCEFGKQTKQSLSEAQIQS